MPAPRHEKHADMIEDQKREHPDPQPVHSIMACAGHARPPSSSLRGPTTRGNPESVRSEDHTSELQSLMLHSYSVFCLKKKKPHSTPKHNSNLRTTLTLDKNNTKKH